MRKIFLLIITIVLIFSGCVEEKNNENATAETDAPTVLEQDEQKEAVIKEQPVASQNPLEKNEDEADKISEPEQPDERNKQEAADETKQELDELENLLDGLDGADFGDIEYSE